MKKFVVSAIVALMLVVMIVGLSGCNKLVIAKIEFNATNLMEGASIVSESLSGKEKADAKNLLADNNKCWTPSNASKYAKVEISLDGEKTFNTAIISEIGSEVQYFRLQAFVNGEWETFYCSEKIEDQRIISFDIVTTSKIAMTIEKFAFKSNNAKIKSFKLFNLVSDRQNNFNTTFYQRIDIVKPSEVLDKGEEYAKTFARYYDVYNTVIIFDVVNWDAQGKLVFKNEGVDGLSGEDYFKREIKALKELVAMRTNPHKVRIIVTALADGAGGGHEGVNSLMHANHTRIAEEMIDKFIKSEKDGGFDLDGLDIDWEYPQNKKDWACYDMFMKELDEKMAQVKPDAIISAALSAWALGMKPETMEIIDQIQYMAYDDMDSDGIQSTIYNAQKGIALFVKNGAKKK